MKTMTPDDALVDLQEVAFDLARKARVQGAASRKEALKLIIEASKKLTNELVGRAEGTIPDDEE